MQAEHPLVGAEIKQWRRQRQLSQLQLSLAAGISARHLCFVENGRAHPGRQLILSVAEALDVPLGARNALLMRAGFAPVVGLRDFEDKSFDSVRSIVNLTLETHKPFPAHVIDRYWNIVASNAAVPELFENVAPALLQRPVNLIRIMLHPEGVAPRLLNYAVWRGRYLAHLERQIGTTSDPAQRALYEETSSYPVPSAAESAGHDGSHGPAETLAVATRLGVLNFLSATTIFGIPSHLTLEEIALELLYPADDQTARLVRRGQAAGT